VTRRAEQAEAERDELRGEIAATVARLADMAKIRADQDGAELVRLRARVAELEARDTPGWRNRAERAEAAIARVRRLCELTIRTSVRVQAIDQARDTLAALDQPAEAPAPPPPGSTREQLPAEILALIEPDLPNYLSTACSTGQLLDCDLDQPHASERNTWAERMHQRCRLNHKFTGQLCCCDCHNELSAPAADEG
jgi:hypothetical protein